MGRLLAGTAVLLSLVVAAGCDLDLGEVPFYCCKDCNPQCPDGYECKGNFCVKKGSCPAFVPNCCGNNKCEAGETMASCPSDCTGSNDCGNGKCDPGEDATSCPADCSSTATCGDGNCEPGESCTSCPADCGQCPSGCGNGTCDPGETAQSCPGDCSSSNPVCGNGSCEAGETATNCPADCSSSTCTQNDTKCDGTDNIKYCDGGTWYTETCENLCKTQYDYSTGCQFDSTKNKDICLCGVYGKLGELCDDEALCDTSLFCGQFDSSKPGFCTRNCTSDSQCTGGPSGTEAACVLSVGSQYACGFLCDYASCPTGLSCQPLGTDYVCQPQ